MTLDLAPCSALSVIILNLLRELPLSLLFSQVPASYFLAYEILTERNVHMGPYYSGSVYWMPGAFHTSCYQQINKAKPVVSKCSTMARPM